jgi:hypothetical protein
VLADLVPHRDVAKHELRDASDTELTEARDVEAEDDASAVAGVGVAESDLHAARNLRLRIVVQDPEDLHLVGGSDLDAHVLGREAGEPLELLGEDGRRRVRRLGVVGVAAACVGHLREQVLVEVGAEADRGGADPRLARGLRDSDELVRVGDADVGEACSGSRICSTRFSPSGQPKMLSTTAPPGSAQQGSTA